MRGTAAAVGACWSWLHSACTPEWTADRGPARHVAALVSCPWLRIMVCSCCFLACPAVCVDVVTGAHRPVHGTVPACSPNAPSMLAGALRGRTRAWRRRGRRVANRHSPVWHTWDVPEAWPLLAELTPHPDALAAVFIRAMTTCDHNTFGVQVQGAAPRLLMHPSRRPGSGGGGVAVGTEAEAGFWRSCWPCRVRDVLLALLPAQRWATLLQTRVARPRMALRGLANNVASLAGGCEAGWRCACTAVWRGMRGGWVRAVPVVCVHRRWQALVLVAGGVARVECAGVPVGALCGVLVVVFAAVFDSRCVDITAAASFFHSTQLSREPARMVGRPTSRGRVQHRHTGG